MQPSGILDEGGFQPPQQAVPEEELKVEKQMAKFAKTKEFQLLKEHFEGRIEFYQKMLPDGRELTSSANMVELGQSWVVANAVIAELQLIINSYLNAAEAVSGPRPNQPL